MKNYQFVIAFILSCTINHNAFAFMMTPTPKRHRSLEPKKQIWKEKPNDDEEIADLQAEINKLVEDPPVFASWDADNFDEKALPLPFFTAQIVSLASIAFTAWIYYLAFNPPSNPPTL